MNHPGIFFATQPWTASLDLCYASDGALTIPTKRLHHGPLRIQKGFRAEAPTAPQVWHQYILHPPGGIATGDELAISVNAETDSHVLLTSPGATKWYRSDTSEQFARQHIALTVRDACLEWLPAETIYFSGTRAQNTLTLDCSSDSTLFAAEVFCLGRPAAGEVFDKGFVRLQTTLTVDNQAVFCERAVIHGDSPQLNQASGMGGRPILGQLIAYSKHCNGNDRDAVRTTVEQRISQALDAQQIDVGISLIPSIHSEGSFIILRCRSTTIELAWQAVRTAWSVLRPRWTGLAAHYPRIWST